MGIRVDKFPMKALIIGGGGFLGRHLAHHLVESGYCQSKSHVSIFDLSKTFDNAGEFNWIIGDISNVQLLEESMRGIDVVFHVASPPYHLNDRQCFFRVNVTATYGVLDACKKAGVEKLVLTSSASVVYNGQDVRNGSESVSEEDDTIAYLTDDHGDNVFIDYYTQTKMLQERIVLQANCSELKTIAIRPHGIFGPGDHTVSEILRKSQEGKMKFIIGDGSNIVDFTYVRNVTHGLICAARQLDHVSWTDEKVCGRPFNITNDEPIHFWVFTSAMLTKLGQPAPYIHLPFYLILMLAYLLHFIHTLASVFIPKLKPSFLTPFKVCLAGTHHYYSCDKAKRYLDYKPIVSLKDGMEITAKSLQ